MGPTAIGKSQLLVELAISLPFSSAILGADSMQMYRAAPILSGAPEADLRQRLPHYIIGELAETESNSVQRYAELAHKTCQDLQRQNCLPLVVGGTGLYLQTLWQGLDPGPTPSAEQQQLLASLSLEELTAQLRQTAPEKAKNIDCANRRRVERALLHAWAGHEPQPPKPGDLRGVCVLERDREDLTHRIHARVEAMISAGAIDEVAALQDQPLSTTFRQMLGFNLICQHLQGELGLAELRERWKQATRHYAKRQMTWIRGRFSQWPRINLSKTPLKDVLAQLTALVIPDPYTVSMKGR